MLLPKLLPSYEYSELEYYKFIIFMFPFLLFGSHSGYLYYRFTVKEDRFDSLLLFGTVQLGVFSFIFGVMSQSAYYAIAGFLMGIMVIIEQRVQVEKRFTLALAGKPLISVFLMLVAYLSWSDVLSNIGSNKVLLLSVFLGFVAWILIVVFFIRDAVCVKDGWELNKYFELIKVGFSINVATILLMLTFFLDRYITKQYYPDYLASYSFSYNLIQFVILALTTIGYVNTVKVGEQVDELSFSVLIEKLICTYRVFVFILCLFFVFLYFIRIFYSFEGFILLSVIMSIFIGNFFCINSISSVALYKGFQNKATSMLAIVFFFNVLFSYVLVILNVEHHWVILKTGLLLNIYSVAFLLMSKKRLRSNS